MNARQLSDLEFIKTNSWPHWPFCPVRKANGLIDNKTAGAICALDGRTIVHHLYVFDLPIRQPAEGWLTFIEKFIKTEYDSIEAMLLDGWFVD